MKRFATTVAFAAVLALSALSFSGVGAAQAHDGGHSDGCQGFGKGFVAGVLAGPDFGQTLRVFAPSAPGVVAGMVDSDGHALCN